MKKIFAWIEKVKKTFQLFGIMGEVYIFNMLLLFLAFLVMALIVSYNFSRQGRTYQMNYNYAALKGIENLMHEQENQFMEVLKSSYYESLNGGNIFGNPEMDSSQEEEQKQRKSRISDFLHNSFNTGYGSLSVYSAKDDCAYTYMNRRIYTYTDDTVNEMRNVYKDKHAHLVMTSSTISGRHGKDRTYGMIYSIRSVDTYENIGALQLEYKTGLIDYLLEKSYPSVMGDFLIIGANGEVFYDSTGQWYEKIYPYAAQLLESKGETRTIKFGEGKYYFNSLQAETELYHGLHYFGFLAYDEVYQNIRITLNYMIGVMGIMIIISGIAMFINVQAKSRILRKIYAAMKNVRQGNLDVQVELSGGRQGELTEIAYSFNKMTVDLKGYIKREYQLKLEQQQYLLMALQAQINPHFLANSFEAIRMKAMLDGEKEIEQMVMILSKIFRNAAKGDTVLTIGTEVDNCESYLWLHKIRFQNQLSYHLEVPEEVRQYVIVRHALQVIVENYMVYSFDGSREDNEISIRGEKAGDWIILTIQDNSEGVSEEKLEEMRGYIRDPQSTDQRKHIGLGNVSRRMRIVFGDDFQFTIDSAQDGGLIEKLKFRACIEEEVGHAVQSDTGRR
ncbi:MAG TPA: histidine kinase [Clostridiales bacterium]|nr:histidine kinase [Clostridiales bacterium]